MSDVSGYLVTQNLSEEQPVALFVGEDAKERAEQFADELNKMPRHEGWTSFVAEELPLNPDVPTVDEIVDRNGQWFLRIV